MSGPAVGKVSRRRSWRVAIAPILALIVWAAWWETRDPVVDLPRDRSIADAVETIVRHSTGRLVQHFTLSDGVLGRIGLDRFRLWCRRVWRDKHSLPLGASALGEGD